MTGRRPCIDDQNAFSCALWDAVVPVSPSQNNMLPSRRIPILRKIAMLAVMSSLALGLSATAFADTATVLRVVTVKTDDVAAYTH